MHVPQSFTGGGLAIRFYFVMVHYVHGVFLSVLRVDIGGFHEHGGVPNFGYTPYWKSHFTLTPLGK